MGLRILRITAFVVMLIAVIHVTDVICVECKYGRVTQRSLKHTGLRIVTSLEPTFSYFCLAGLLYALTDVNIRRQNARDLSRADYGEPPAK
jgi:hypothetical protein